MEWIPFRPPRIGLWVEYSGDSSARPGKYVVVENDEYNMVGYVVIEDLRGNRWGVNAERLEPCA